MGVYIATLNLVNVIVMKMSQAKTPLSMQSFRREWWAHAKDAQYEPTAAVLEWLNEVCPCTEAKAKAKATSKAKAEPAAKRRRKDADHLE